MALLVAKTKHKAHADRLVAFLKKAGSTHTLKIKEGDQGFLVEFSAFDVLEWYLHEKGEEGRKSLNMILQEMGSSRRILSLLVDKSPDAAVLRRSVIGVCRERLRDFPE